MSNHVILTESKLCEQSLPLLGQLGVIMDKCIFGSIPNSLLQGTKPHVSVISMICLFLSMRIILEKMINY